MTKSSTGDQLQQNGQIQFDFSLSTRHTVVLLNEINIKAILYPILTYFKMPTSKGKYTDCVKVMCIACIL